MCVGEESKLGPLFGLRIMIFIIVSCMSCSNALLRGDAFRLCPPFQVNSLVYILLRRALLHLSLTSHIALHWHKASGQSYIIYNYIYTHI